MALASDPRDASVWVAIREELIHLSSEGDIVDRVSFPNSGEEKIRPSELVLYVDVLPPLLSVLAPLDHSVLNDADPVIRVGYADLGVGVNPSSLRLERLSQQLVVSCRTAQEGALCTLPVPLPEGPVELTARVEDFNGNLSAPATVAFTVDTLPPTISLFSPPDGLLTNMPVQTFSGRISEPAELLLNEQAVPLTSDREFKQRVSLEPAFPI